ncbi:MAG: hypothetical protein ABI016_16930 [Chthoniobacterales bacterium]
MKTYPTPRTALLLALCFGLTSCQASSSKSRAESIQFAYSWEQTINALGLPGMADLQEVESQARTLEPERTALQADGSEVVRREAEQLDTLILYVARSLDENLKANVTLPEGVSGGKPVPVDFPNSTLNTLLGLNGDGGDETPQKALTALHEAIVRFAKAAGVEQDFLGAKRRKEQADAETGRKASAPAPTWPQIRNAAIQVASQKKTFHARERELAESEASALKAPVGFAGAKWRMYPEEVKNVRPKTVPDPEGNLSEAMEWLGRPAMAKYIFDQVFDQKPTLEIVAGGRPKFLVTVIVTFQGRATRADMDKTQAYLQTAHGNMPTLSATVEYSLVSHYKQGRISIWHRLRQDNIEEVVFAREISE